MGDQLSHGMQLASPLNSVGQEYEAVVAAMRTIQDDITWDNCVARLINEGDIQKANRHNGRQEGRGGHGSGGPSGIRALNVGPTKGAGGCFDFSKGGNLAADCPGGDQRLDDEDKR